MRYKIISIAPQIINTSTLIENDYIIESTIINYQIVYIGDLVHALAVTVELKGEVTMKEIKDFIMKEHGHQRT